MLEQVGNEFDFCSFGEQWDSFTKYSLLNLRIVLFQLVKIWPLHLVAGPIADFVYFHFVFSCEVGVAKSDVH